MRGLWGVIFAGIVIGLVFAFGWMRSSRRRRRREVQKLLALAAKEGTLTPAMLQAALGYSKEGAEKALGRMRSEGLAQFDVNDSGEPVYRVEQAAMEARKHRGW